MTQRSWHIVRHEGVLTLSRQLPARFDFSATTVIANGARFGRARLAHQVRQDMWRALQSLRGFSPVVQVHAEGKDMHIRAGGSVASTFPRQACEDAISTLLNDPDKRARWVRCCAKGAV